MDQIFLIEDEYRLTQLISEEAWVEKLIGEMKDDALTEILPHTGNLASHTNDEFGGRGMNGCSNIS